MRINYVCIADPTRLGGGGEMIAAELLAAGTERGHRFRITAVRPTARTEFDADADLDLLVDVFNHPATIRSGGAWRDLPRGLLQECVRRGRFVHLSNAYVDVCDLPYLPCSGEARDRCPFKSPWNVRRNLAARDFEESCFGRRPHARELFEKSPLNVFLSPLHRDTCLGVLQLDAGRPSLVLRPTVDTRVFRDMGLPRDIEYLFVGVLGEAKGLEAMRREFGRRDIHLVGRVQRGARVDFGTYHGAVPYSEIPKFMNRARNFVFLPRWPEPQGRVVVEAALCGCKLLTNDRVGATSFPFDLSRPENFADAAVEFWERVEALRS